MTIPIQVVTSRIKETHGDEIVMDESTFKTTYQKCRFIDKKYGEFWNTPRNLYLQGQSHPAKRIEKILRTKREKGIISNSIKTCQELAIQHGGKCLSMEYKNSKEKLLWECSKNHKFKMNLGKVKNRKQWCPGCRLERQKNTLMERYGVTVPCKNKDIAMKCAKSFNNSHVLYHWKTRTRTYLPRFL